MGTSAFKSVDHVLVRVKNAPLMMDLFATKLGLPVSWPLQSNDFATYGWVTLGNTNLEFWAASNNSDLPSDDVLPLFHGLALEPDNLPESIQMLLGRGIKCKAPRPYITQTPDGRDVTNFTNSVVLDLSSPLVCIFFCEWGLDGTIFPWHEKLTTTQQKLKQQQLLSACDGGKLGITGLVAVEMLCTQIDETKAKWLALTGRSATPITQGGIELRLQAGNVDRIESIVIGVRSLATTRDVLSEAGLLGACTGNKVSMSPTACPGLHFCFCQT